MHARNELENLQRKQKAKIENCHVTVLIPSFEYDGDKKTTRQDGEGEQRKGIHCQMKCYMQIYV